MIDCPDILDVDDVCDDGPMTLVIAHRGASAAEPENTIAAFRRAFEIGADGVELDVRRTADDQLVIHHDAHLADGRVVRETARLDLPGHVPTLDEALDACDGMFVNIEIKNSRTDPDHDPNHWVAVRLGAELVARGGGARWLISSFSYRTVDRSRLVNPAARTAWLTMDLTSASIERAAAGGHDAIHPSVDAVDEVGIRLAHRHGLAVNVWTCDDPERMRELIGWGVDGICTNVPDVALAVRSGLA
jgi:glycerophosphoryl diester phosphodiesterase